MHGNARKRGRRHPGRRTTRGSARERTLNDAQAIYLASLEPDEPPPGRSTFERIQGADHQPVYFVTTTDGQVVQIEIKRD